MDFLNVMVYVVIVIWFFLGIKIETANGIVKRLKSIEFQLTPIIIGLLYYWFHI